MLNSAQVAEVIRLIQVQSKARETLGDDYNKDNYQAWVKAGDDLTKYVKSLEGA